MVGTLFQHFLVVIAVVMTSCLGFRRAPFQLQGFIRLIAHVGSGDPVRILRLYTTNTLDEVCSIYC